MMSQNTTSGATITGTVVPILSFTVPYQLSAITADIKWEMMLAIAAVLGLGDPSMVVLTFTTVDRRRRLLQQSGVVVNVGLVGYSGSVSQLVSKVSLQSLNSNLEAQGLQGAQGLQIVATGSPGDRGVKGRVETDCGAAFPSSAASMPAVQRCARTRVPPFRHIPDALGPLRAAGTNATHNSTSGPLLPPQPSDPTAAITGGVVGGFFGALLVGGGVAYAYKMQSTAARKGAPPLPLQSPPNVTGHSKPFCSAKTRPEQGVSEPVASLGRVPDGPPHRAELTPRGAQRQMWPPSPPPPPRPLPTPIWRAGGARPAPPAPPLCLQQSHQKRAPLRPLLRRDDVLPVDESASRACGPAAADPNPRCHQLSTPAPALPPLSPMGA